MTLVAVLVRLAQVQGEQAPRDAEVRVVEVVVLSEGEGSGARGRGGATAGCRAGCTHDVPADLAVLAPLEDDGVQEAEHVHKRLEGGVRALCEGAGVRCDPAPAPPPPHEAPPHPPSSACRSWRRRSAC